MATRLLTHTPYLKSLQEYTLSELTDLEREVIATMTTPGWAVIEGLWARQEEEMKDELAQLKPSSDLVDFVAQSAEIRGLQRAREANKALAKVAERRREEAERKHG